MDFNKLYHDFKSGILPIPLPNTYYQFLNNINENYFDNTLKISTDENGVSYINNRTDICSSQGDMKYLIDLYELYSIKHKIERVWEE